MFLKSLVYDVALGWLLQSETGVRGAILNTIGKLSGFTFKSVYIIFIAFITVELNYPRVIVAVVHAKSDAGDAVEVQDRNVWSDDVDQRRAQVHEDNRQLKFGH